MQSPDPKHISPTGQIYGRCSPPKEERCAVYKIPGTVIAWKMTNRCVLIYVKQSRGTGSKAIDVTSEMEAMVANIERERHE